MRTSKVQFRRTIAYFEEGWYGDGGSNYGNEVTMLFSWDYAGRQYDPSTLYRLGGIYLKELKRLEINVLLVEDCYRVFEIRPANGELAGFFASARDLFNVYRTVVSGAEVTAHVMDAAGALRSEHGAWLIAKGAGAGTTQPSSHPSWLRLDLHLLGRDAPATGGPAKGGMTCFARFGEGGYWSVACANPFLPIDGIIRFYEAARRCSLPEVDRIEMRTLLEKYLA